MVILHISIKTFMVWTVFDGITGLDIESLVLISTIIDLMVNYLSICLQFCLNCCEIWGFVGRVPFLMIFSEFFFLYTLFSQMYQDLFKLSIPANSDLFHDSFLFFYSMINQARILLFLSLVKIHSRASNIGITEHHRLIE